MSEKNIVSNPNFVLGILGGGQLGKMLIQAASSFDIYIKVLDPNPDCSAYPYCHKFVQGDFNDYQTVVDFGVDCDALTIEIEHVNAEALKYLEEQGKAVHPAPAPLNIIKDKGLQKEFYQKHHLPTSPFILLENKAAIIEAINKQEIKFPFVQKSRTDGYDGKGVAVITDSSKLHKLLDCPSLIEEKISIKKELAVIVAQSKGEEPVCFPVVDMLFNETANLVEFLMCPADISQEIEDKCYTTAIEVVKKLQIRGVLAVELFLTHDNEILINEVAPRPHNSGHHTIDSCTTSQYEQHLRSVLDFPLGSTKELSPSVMLNILGNEGYSGKVEYQNLNECLAVAGAKFHFYGKKETRPFRKMGHVTVVSTSVEDALEKAKKIQNKLNVISYE